jgi:transposase
MLIFQEGLQFIRQTIEALPDSTILELVAAYEEEFGVAMSRATMSRAVNETLGFTRKKGVSARQPR